MKPARTTTGCAEELFIMPMIPLAGDLTGEALEREAAAAVCRLLSMAGIKAYAAECSSADAEFLTSEPPAAAQGARHEGLSIFAAAPPRVPTTGGSSTAQHQIAATHQLRRGAKPCRHQTKI
jgi:hypothetical protein